MKKLIYISLLTVGFSLNSTAQTVAKTANELQKQDAAPTKTLDDAASEAKLDVKTIANFIPLDDATVQAFFQLLTMKYSVLFDATSSTERKTSIKADVTAKIRATLNATQMKQLEANTELFYKITN